MKTAEIDDGNVLLCVNPSGYTAKDAGGAEIIAGIVFFKRT